MIFPYALWRKSRFAIAPFLLIFLLLAAGCQRGTSPSTAHNDADSLAASGAGGDAHTLSIEDLHHLQFRQLSSDNDLPCDEVSALYQDREGFLWIGTKYGLFQYDGFRFKTYKNTTSNPRRLTSNNITCLTDDANYLWIGTDRGVNRMNKRTGQVRHYALTDYDNCRQCDRLLLTRSGDLWIGTDGGLYLYDAKADSFVFHSNERGNTLVPHCSVKSLVEDERGYLWVGTWDKGLFRYDMREKVWYAMPKFNDGNSAQTICADPRGRLWVGTWNHGLYRIDNPYATGEPLRFVCFHAGEGEGQLQSDIIYSLLVEPSSQTLWVGNRRGLAICSLDATPASPFILYPQGNDPSQRDMSHGLSNIYTDRSGLIWMHQDEGILSTRLAPHNFTSYSTEKFLPAGRIDELRYVGSDAYGGFFICLSDNGLLRLAPDGTTTDITAAATGRNDVCVNAVLAQSDGTLLVATLRHGLFVNKSGQITNYNRDNASWLADNCIYCLRPEGERLLLGTYEGLCVLTSDKGQRVEQVSGIDIGHARIKHILSTADGYWLSTSNQGLIYLKKDLSHASAYDHAFTSAGNAVDFVGVQQTLCDTHGRLWVVSHEMGLMRYDKAQDRLMSMNKHFGIPDENVNGLLEDTQGRLWLSTNYGLVRMAVADSDRLDDRCTFTTLDGLPSNYYGKGGAFNLPDGQLAFYNNTNITLFSPERIKTNVAPPRVGVTGIRLYNQSLEELDDSIADALPPFMRQLTLEPSQNDLIIDFSTFTYENAQAIRFACRLECYDKDWNYLEAGVHSVSYSQMPPGTYTFHLRASNAKSAWSSDRTCFTLTVLPPLYARWWAYLIYIVIASAVSYVVVRYLHKREQHRRRRHLELMERKNADELNHKKLQFFTNITHDLMTPLTIIKATVEEMQQEHAHIKDEAATITNNVDRLMRMLQQILAFRKSETGNLRLSVSQGDIVNFCQHEVESIKPLMKQKQLTLTFHCDKESAMAYFDSDVLDKILYNLLSNAAKYGRQGGFVNLSLAFGDDGQRVCLKISDNGHGIAKSKQKDLFKRFYEGEHRRFNTYGTGIGLSLTKDYVELCHGTIAVESAEEKGTTFTITLPTSRQLFLPDEIEGCRDIIHGISTQSLYDEAEEGAQADNDRTTILVVEDNEELLGLMSRLLQKDYRVRFATNGRSALDIVKSSESIELIVSDVMMPEMDGIELTRTIKGDLKTSHIPIILLTAKRTDESRTEAYDAGADGYITKPFSLSLLSSRIRNLLRKREAAARNFKTQYEVSLSGLQVTDLDADFLRRCMDCIQQHLSDADFDQQQMADALSVSRSTLYKKLKSLTGMNVSGFMRNIRMKAACRMMEANAKIRISEIAFAVGYNDPKYFSTCFRKDFGIQPSEYLARQHGIGDTEVEK